LFYHFTNSGEVYQFDGETPHEVMHRYHMDLLRGIKYPETPVEIRQVGGRPPSDAIWASLGPAIHPRVKQALISSGVTGWKTYPVVVYDKRGQLIPDYDGLSITGRCESIRMDRSKIVYQENERGCFPYYQGIGFDIATWDGSDLFMASDLKTTFMLATGKVERALKSIKAKCVAFKPIADVRIPASELQYILKNHPC
jgi:hypothetical protein